MLHTYLFSITIFLSFTIVTFFTREDTLIVTIVILYLCDYIVAFHAQEK